MTHERLSYASPNSHAICLIRKDCGEFVYNDPHFLLHRITSPREHRPLPKTLDGGANNEIRDMLVPVDKGWKYHDISNVMDIRNKEYDDVLVCKRTLWFSGLLVMSFVPLCNESYVRAVCKEPVALDDGSGHMYMCHRHNHSSATTANSTKHRGEGYVKHSTLPDSIKADFNKTLHEREYVAALKDERARFLEAGFTRFNNQGRIISTLFSSKSVNAKKRVAESNHAQGAAKKGKGIVHDTEGEEVGEHGDTTSEVNSVGDTLCAVWSNMVVGDVNEEDDAFTVRIIIPLIIMAHTCSCVFNTNTLCVGV